MWLVKPAIAVGIIWYLTRGSQASAAAHSCPPGSIYIPLYGCAAVLNTTSEPANPGIGITVVKTTSECDPSSPIYDPARCVATAGVTRIAPLTKQVRGISPGAGIEPLTL